jgi:hypothetical protein
VAQVKVNGLVYHTSLFYNNNYDKNSNKKHVFQSIILYIIMFVFILINMLTRDTGMTL